jgi:NAD(P)-dependent dehydrogenase (short-subunit alcohol dehydrogenase family)
VIAAGYMKPGSAIGMISSAAGLGWEANIELVQDYLNQRDFDSAAAWIEKNGHADYMFSKQTICTYVAQEAMNMLKRGIRINAILPGPTDTPLAQANAEMWLGFGTDFRDEVGIKASTPDEQAGPLAFLCSDAARYVNGITMITDAGYISAGLTDAFPPAKPVAEFLYGRLT